MVLKKKRFRWDPKRSFVCNHNDVEILKKHQDYYLCRCLNCHHTVWVPVSDVVVGGD